MSEQLQQSMNDILVKAIEAIEQGAEWMAGEIPQVIEQLILWTIVSNVIWAVFMVVFIIVYVKYGLNYPKYMEKAAGDADMALTLAFIVGGVASACFVVVAPLLLEEAFKAAIAPKLWLLEYAVDMVKPAS